MDSEPGADNSPSADRGGREEGREESDFSGSPKTKKTCLCAERC